MRSDEMIEFAKVYDPEPFHLSVEGAKTHGWDGLFASGLQIASIWRRLSKDAFPNSQTVISPGWDNIRWLQPVYAGDALSSSTEIIEARKLSSRPNEGLVRLSSKMTGRSGQVVATLISNWFVRQRPAEEG
jgi:acyl dehydratase